MCPLASHGPYEGYSRLSVSLAQGRTKYPDKDEILDAHLVSPFGALLAGKERGFLADV